MTSIEFSAIELLRLHSYVMDIRKIKLGLRIPKDFKAFTRIHKDSKDSKEIFNNLQEVDCNPMDSNVLQWILKKSRDF